LAKVVRRKKRLAPHIEKIKKGYAGTYDGKRKKKPAEYKPKKFRPDSTPYFWI